MNLKNLFLKNSDTKQIVVKNTFWLTSAEVITGLLRLALVVFAARALGAMEYGKFTFAYSFVSLFAIAGDMGLSTLIIREFSRDRQKEQEYPAIISLKIFLGVVVFLITLISAFFIGSVQELGSIIVILALFIFSEGFFNLVYPFIRARQKMEYEALIKVSQALCTVVIGSTLIFYFPFARSLGYGYLVASLITLGVVAVFFHRIAYPLRLEFAVIAWKRLLANSWPMAFGFVSTWAYLNLDSVMIGFFANAPEVGWYNAASKIILSLTVIVASLFSRSFFPALSRLYSQSREALQKSMHDYLEIMTMLSLPLVVGGWILAPGIINFLYGSTAYSPAIFVFQLLLVVAGITFLHYPYSMVLVVAGHQKKNFFIMAIGIALHIVLNSLLVPVFGFYVAAANTIAVSLLTLIIMMVFVRYYIDITVVSWHFCKVFFAALASSIVMAFFVTRFSMHYLPIPIIIVLGCVVYSMLFLSLKKLLIERF